MIHFYFLAFFLLALVSASTPPHEVTEFSKRDVTGDSKCTPTMCISAVVNGSTVQYTLSGTGRRTVGWMGMGFGIEMRGSPMVIMWGNKDGSVTLSQRQAPGNDMPTLVSNPPRVATLSTALSTTSGNSVFVYTIPANSDTQQSLIFGFSPVNPGSSDESATLQQHLDYGVIQLDLTKTLPDSGTSTGDTSSGTTDSVLKEYQGMVVAHAILCAVGFALLLPTGALLARYLRTFLPTWYTGHWIAQFGIAGPVIIVGVGLGFKASGGGGYKLLDDHKRTGIILSFFYVAQCAVGALIHFVKPKNPRGRPPQNYFHAVFGLFIIGFAMYQIRSGYNEEWPKFTGLGPVAKGVNTLWIVWCAVLPILYAGGLVFLRKQYRQEEAARKGLNREFVDMSTVHLQASDERYHDE